MASSAVYSSADIEGGNGNGNPRSGGMKWTPSTMALAALGTILLVFPYIAIPILFALYKPTSGTNQSNYYSSTTTASITSVSATLSASTSLSQGQVVSISSTGTMQLGAGSSIYKGVGALPTALCPKYLDASPLYNNTYLVSYAAARSTASTLAVVQFNPVTKKGTTLTSQTVAFNAYETDILNQQTGLFVALTDQQTYFTAGQVKSAYVYAGVSDNTKNYAMKLGTPQPFCNGYVISPHIVGLSPTTFAIVYQNISYAPDYSVVYSFLQTVIGTVNPTTLAITLSTPLVIANNPNLQLTNLVVSPISAYQYVALWVNLACTACGTSGNIGELNAVVVTGTIPATAAVQPVLSMGAISNLVGSLAFGFIDVTTLNANNIVVAYTDVTSNYGISATIVNIDTVKKTVLFGSTLQLTTGLTQGQFNYVYTNAGTAITTIADGSEFMILFSDLHNGGAMTSVIGKFTVSSELVRASPNFVLNTGNPDVNNYYSWGALAVGSRSSYSSQIAMFSALTKNEAAGSTCLNVAQMDFSLMEIKPRPIGVVTTPSVLLSTPLTSGAIAVSGTVSGYSNLIIGKMYYTTTGGQLIADSNFYGRDGLSSNAAIDEYQYIYDPINNVIVTVDSQVGLAIAADTIVLRLT